MPDLKTVEAAGGLTLDADDNALFIYKNGRWDLPKGLIEPPQGGRETALREVSEETGLPLESLRIQSELIPTTHVSKFAKQRSLKRTIWFYLRHDGIRSPLDPQIEEGIERCAWIPLAQLEVPLANCPMRILYLVNFWLKIRKDLEKA